MISGRFGRHVKLNSPEDFNRVFKQSIRFAGKNLTVLAANNHKDYSRLGTAIPKKIVRRAIDRNRIKRVIRESFRVNQRSIAGYDVVVLANKGVETKNNMELRNDLESHWVAISKKA